MHFIKILIASIALLLCFNSSAQTKDEISKDLFALGNYTKAIEAYKACEICDYFEKQHKIAQAYNALGNYGKAISNYEKLIEDYSENLIVRYELAKLYLKTKKYNKAKSDFTKLIALDSLNPNFHYQLGFTLNKQRDTLAYASYQKVLELDDTHQKAIQKLAKRFLIQQEFKQAHQLLDKGLSSYPNNVLLISLKAQTYYFADDDTNTIKWFNKLLNLGEKTEFIHNKLSISYANNSDYEEAIYHRKQALKFDSNNARGLLAIGKYYERLNNFQKAEEYIDKALTQIDLPLDKEYSLLGRVLNRQKKHQKALKAFQKAKKENPKDVMIDFYILNTKDAFYADLDSRIKLHETFIKKNQKHPLKNLVERKLKELKEEKFFEANED